MVQTAYNYGTSVSESGSDGAYTNDANFEGSSTSSYAYARITFSFGFWTEDRTNWLQVTIPGFTEIPTDATIDSVEIEVHADNIVISGGGNRTLRTYFQFRNSTTTEHSWTTISESKLWFTSTDNTPPSTAIMRGTALNVRVRMIGTGTPTDPSEFEERLYSARVRVNYTEAPKYPNDVQGVLSTNIAKIQGVATANIAKVSGS